MGKKTLLDIVQSVMSSMNSDHVTSIDDMEESMDIANQAKEVYEDLMSIKDWKHLMQVSTLESFADNTKPTVLKIPEDVSKITEVRYDKRTDLTGRRKLETVEYREPEEFLDLCLGRDDTSAGVQLMELPNSTVSIPVYNDRHPTYWTSFDDQHMIFDSFDSELDDCLQESKNLIRVKKLPTFSMNDDFIPEMPVDMFPLYLQEVKRVCFNYFKEQASPNDERRAFRSLGRQTNKGGKLLHRRTKRGRS